MASQSLYRKWRSQTFAELVGQEHVVRTLRNAIREDRVAHAYLFTGPRGVGKTSTARLVAKAVNCTAPPTDRPCGVCESCRTITDGRSVDIIEMDAASHTSVDDARDLIERVQFRPTQGRYKVYVIDEVHMLSTAAFNALLKTLEEPPDHAIFILATTEVHKIPATILSRCQRFHFARHTISDIARHIQAIAEAEGLALAPDVAAAIARAATGSMRDALGVLEQLAAFGDGTIDLAQVQQLLGVSSSTEVDTLVVALLEQDIAAALHLINSVADQGIDMRQFARDLVERLRALLLVTVTDDLSAVDVSEDERAMLADWKQYAPPAMLVQWIKLFSNLDFQLRTSPYGHLPLELALVEALVATTPPTAAAPPAPPPARPVAKPRTPERTAEAPPTVKRQDAPPTRPARSAPVREPPPEPEPAPAEAAQPAPAPVPEPAPDVPEPEPAATPAASAPGDEIHDTAPPEPEQATMAALPPLDAAEQQHAAQEVEAELSLFEQVEQAWTAIKRDVRVEDRTLEAILNSVQPTDVEGHTVVLLAASDFHRRNIEKPNNRRVIEAVLSKHLGQNIAFRCEDQEQEKKQEDPRRVIQDSLKDTRVRRARNIFHAEVIDVVAAEELE